MIFYASKMGKAIPASSDSSPDRFEKGQLIKD